MAAITIKGIRIDSVTIKPSGDDEKIEASYSLISSADKVLATQTCGGYNGLKFGLSPATHGALDAFLKAYKADVNLVLGLESE